MNARVRTCDAGDRQTHRFDSAQVVPRILAVETPFRNLDLARPGRLQLQECEREIESQGQSRDELLLAPILIEVRLLHRAQRARQTLASEQTFVQPVPDIERQVSLRCQLAFQLE